MTSSTGDIYNRKIGGKLKLKGVSKAKGLKIKKSSNNNESGTNDDSSKQTLGTGRILSTGKTIQGFETKFLEEAKCGDLLIIKHPLTHLNEERVIESILSHRTLCIDQPFSNDLITTTQFYIRKLEDIQDNDELEALKTLKRSSQLVTLREKTGMWGYKTVTKKVNSTMTAEDRLNERVKSSRDKYCW